MHDIFTGDAELPSNPERSRNKRLAAAAVILSSLAAGIAGDLWGQHQTREDLLRLADQQNRMIAVLQKDETRLNMEADHQREIRVARVSISMKKHQNLLTVAENPYHKKSLARQLGIQFCLSSQLKTGQVQK